MNSSCSQSVPEMSSYLLNSSRKKTQMAPKKDWANKQKKGSLMVFRLWSTNPQPLLKDCGKKKSPPLSWSLLRILLPVSQLVVGRLSCSNQPWRTASTSTPPSLSLRFHWGFHGLRTTREALGRGFTMGVISSGRSSSFVFFFGLILNGLHHTLSHPFFRLTRPIQLNVFTRPYTAKE